MKILYLLFAVVFLVLMAVPGFSQAQLTRRQCRRYGGDCYHPACPYISQRIGGCIPFGHCCQTRLRV